jgi:hypothetical protein
MMVEFFSTEIGLEGAELKCHGVLRDDVGRLAELHRGLVFPFDSDDLRAMLALGLGFLCPIARYTLSGSTMSLISTAVTCVPHGSVCPSITFLTDRNSRRPPRCVLGRYLWLLRRDLHRNRAQGHAHHLSDGKEDEREARPAHALKFSEKKYDATLVLPQHAKRAEEIHDDRHAESPENDSPIVTDTIDYVTTNHTDPPLLLGALLAEGGIHLILFDTGRRVTTLIEILLFGAVAHHAGMGNVSCLIGVLRNRGLIRHIKCSSTTTA